MPYDLFVSYRHLDADRVRPLVESLRGLGVDVWFDERVIADFAPITDAIRKGLAQSKALLAWYSADYPYSRPCLMELTAAYLAAGQANDSTARVLVINPDAGIEHIQPLPLRDNLFLHGELGPTELAIRITAHLATVDTPLGAILSVTGPPQYGSHITGGSRFVGRLAQMWDLHTRLQEREHAIISGRTGPGLAQVVGMGGQGKSLLAEEYALRFGSIYPGGIFWLHARVQDASIADRTQEGQAIIRDSAFRDIAQRLGIAVQGLTLAELEGKLSKTLREQGQPFLWVVDDIATGLPMEAVRAWYAPDILGKTLITTRSREYSSDQERLNLDVLDPNAAKQLFLSHRKRLQAPPSEEEDHLVQKIAVDRLGRHALAVDVAGSAALRMGYAEFLNKLDSPNDDVLKLAAQLGSQLPNGHEKDIAATFLQSINLLDEMGHDYLQLAACLAAAPIPRSLVSLVFANVDKLSPTQAEIKALLATDQVAELSLAEDQSDEQHSQTVHLLIARTMRFHDPTPERTNALRGAAVAVLAEALAPVLDIRSHASLAQEVEHSRHLCQNTVADKADTNLAVLASKVGLHDYALGSYASAKNLLGKALEIQRRILSEEHLDTVTTMGNLATNLYAQGDLNDSCALQKRVLEIRNRIQGEEHPDTITSMNNLGSVIKAQGDLDGARTLQEKAVEILRRTQGGEHPNTLTSMNNLAITLHIQGDLSGARTLQEKLIEIRRRILGEEHPNTLNSMNNLANTLLAQGDLDGALELHEKTLMLVMRIQSEEHPSTITTMNNLASTLKAQGNLNGACKLFEKALEIKRRVLGEEHPDTLILMSNLGGTLYAQGDLNSARIIIEKTLKAQRRILGEEHLDTLNSMSTMATVLLEQGDLDGTAFELHKKVLEIERRVLGEEHPRTLKSMSNMAIIFHTKGDLNNARKLDEKTLEIQRRVLGEEHPDTLKSINNLASILFEQDDLNGAHVLQEKVLEIQSRTLGEEHPDTLKSINNLGSTLYAQEDLNGARRHFEKAIEIQRRILGEEHPDTLGSISNLGDTLYAQGDLNGARRLFEKTLESQERVLGEEHPYTIAAMNNMAMTLYAQGDLNGSRELQGKVLKIQKRVLGEEHPNTLTSMNNLAAMLRAQGEQNGARDLLEKALEIQRRILGEKNPDTLILMSNLANIFREQRDLKGARSMEEKVLEIYLCSLGKDHPKTTIAAWNLLVTLITMKDSAAQTIFFCYLSWLLDCDPATLDPEQQNIRERIQRLWPQSNP